MGQVHRAMLIFAQSTAAQPGFESVSADTGAKIETLEQNDGRMRSEHGKANEVKFS